MAEVVYLLCAVTSLACAALLLRSYQPSRMPLVLWTCLCFAGLALNNTLLFFDLVVVPEVDLSFWRDGAALLAVGALLYGLISSDIT